MGKKLLRRISKLLLLLKRHPKGVYSFLINTACYYLKIPYLVALPSHYSIEPTNVCDMHCAVCETGTGVLKRAQGRMTLKQFDLILDQIKSRANTIHLYFMGESFINSDIYEMIAHAEKQNIFVTVCTNGHFIDPERIISSQLDELHFQAGGLDQITHQLYRAGGNLDKLIAAVKEIKRLKILHKQNIPKIIFGFIVMKHNEHQIKDVQSFAKNIGADEINLITPCVRSIDQAHELLPESPDYQYYDRNLLSKGILSPMTKGKRRCPWLFNSTVITWNGDVVPCCRDAQGEYVFGNILTDTLKNILNSPQYVAFRKKVLSGNNPNICSLCAGYGIPELK